MSKTLKIGLAIADRISPEGIEWISRHDKELAKLIIEERSK